ncbi:hypothetical protein BKA69DRAFT_1054563 [Paraphysoderma sedebokerense]|nr:hypothetical protein BKA69DRAFT_1054563 [Paraphysoderma sedebokerense]
MTTSVRTPASISWFAIYNPSFSSSDATVADQLLYYYAAPTSPLSNDSISAKLEDVESKTKSKDELENEQNDYVVDQIALRNIGLSQAIVNFSTTFDVKSSSKLSSKVDATTQNQQTSDPNSNIPSTSISTSKNDASNTSIYPQPNFTPQSNFCVTHSQKTRLIIFQPDVECPYYVALNLNLAYTTRFPNSNSISPSPSFSSSLSSLTSIKTVVEYLDSELQDDVVKTWLTQAIEMFKLVKKGFDNLWDEISSDAAESTQSDNVKPGLGTEDLEDGSSDPRYIHFRKNLSNFRVSIAEFFDKWVARFSQFLSADQLDTFFASIPATISLPVSPQFQSIMTESIKNIQMQFNDVEYSVILRSTGGDITENDGKEGNRKGQRRENRLFNEYQVLWNDLPTQKEVLSLWWYLSFFLDSEKVKTGLSHDTAEQESETEDSVKEKPKKEDKELKSTESSSSLFSFSYFFGRRSTQKGSSSPPPSSSKLSSRPVSPSPQEAQNPSTSEPLVEPISHIVKMYLGVNHEEYHVIIWQLPGYCTFLFFVPIANLRAPSEMSLQSVEESSNLTKPSESPSTSIPLRSDSDSQLPESASSTSLDPQYSKTLHTINLSHDLTNYLISSSPLPQLFTSRVQLSHLQQSLTEIHSFIHIDPKSLSCWSNISAVSSITSSLQSNSKLSSKSIPRSASQLSAKSQSSNRPAADSKDSKKYFLPSMTLLPSSFSLSKPHLPTSSSPSPPPSHSSSSTSTKSAERTTQSSIDERTVSPLLSRYLTSIALPFLSTDKFRFPYELVELYYLPAISFNTSANSTLKSSLSGNPNSQLSEGTEQWITAKSISSSTQTSSQSSASPDILLSFISLNGGLNKSTSNNGSNGGGGKSRKAMGFVAVQETLKTLETDLKNVKGD